MRPASLPSRRTARRPDPTLTTVAPAATSSRTTRTGSESRSVDVPGLYVSPATPICRPSSEPSDSASHVTASCACRSFAAITAANRSGRSHSSPSARSVARSRISVAPENAVPGRNGAVGATRGSARRASATSTASAPANSEIHARSFANAMHSPRYALVACFAISADASRRRLGSALNDASSPAARSNAASSSVPIRRRGGWRKSSSAEPSRRFSGAWARSRPRFAPSSTGFHRAHVPTGICELTRRSAPSGAAARENRDGVVQSRIVGKTRLSERRVVGEIRDGRRCDRSFRVIGDHQRVVDECGRERVVDTGLRDRSVCGRDARAKPGVGIPRDDAVPGRG